MSSATVTSPTPSGVSYVASSPHVSRDRVKLLYIELLESGECFLRDQSTAGTFLASLSPHETKALMHLMKLSPEQALLYFNNDPEVAEVVEYAAQLDSGPFPGFSKKAEPVAATLPGAQDETDGRGAAAPSPSKAPDVNMPTSTFVYADSNEDRGSNGHSGVNGEWVAPGGEMIRRRLSGSPSKFVFDPNVVDAYRGKARSPRSSRSEEQHHTTWSPERMIRSGGAPADNAEPSCEEVDASLELENDVEGVTPAVEEAFNIVKENVTHYVKYPGELSKLCGQLPTGMEKNALLKLVVSRIDPSAPTTGAPGPVVPMLPLQRVVPGISDSSTRPNSDSVSPQRLAQAFTKVLRQFAAYKRNPGSFSDVILGLNRRERAVFDELVKSTWNLSRTDMDW